MFCLIVGFLSAVAVGIGFLLAACIPGLELGHAIIAGSVIAAATLYIYRQMMNAVPDRKEDEEDVAIDEPVVVLPKSFFRHGSWNPKSKGKKKGYE